MIEKNSKDSSTVTSAINQTQRKSPKVINEPETFNQHPYGPRQLPRTSFRIEYEYATPALKTARVCFEIAISFPRTNPTKQRPWTEAAGPDRNLTVRIESIRSNLHFARCTTRRGADTVRSISPCCRPGVPPERTAARTAGPEDGQPRRLSPGRSVIRRGPRARRTCESRRNSRGPRLRPLSRKFTSLESADGRETRARRVGPWAERRGRGGSVR